MARIPLASPLPALLLELGRRPGLLAQRRGYLLWTMCKGVGFAPFVMFLLLPASFGVRYWAGLWRRPCTIMTSRPGQSFRCSPSVCLEYRLGLAVGTDGLLRLILWIVCGDGWKGSAAAYGMIVSHLPPAAAAMGSLKNNELSWPLLWRGKALTERRAMLWYKLASALKRLRLWPPSGPFTRSNQRLLLTLLLCHWPERFRPRWLPKP